MKLVSPEENNEPIAKVASAWMSIVASIILFLMVSYRINKITEGITEGSTEGSTKGSTKGSGIIMNLINVITKPSRWIIGPFMKEGSLLHSLLYLVLFLLVFISAILGFFYKEEE